MTDHVVWALLKENGCVEMAGVSRTPPDGHVPLPAGTTPEIAPYIMYVDGDWQFRPSLPDPVMTATTFSVPECPDGVLCEVRDAETLAHLGSAQSSDGALTVELPDPGQYLLTFSVPDPWHTPDPLILTIPEA